MIHGDLDPWGDTFPDGLLESVVDLLVDTWRTLPPFGAVLKEDQITRKYVTQVRGTKLARRLPFAVHSQYELIDPGSGDIVGIIDLCAVHGHREEVYLAFECKRLRVPHAHGVYERASEYVKEGMLRFTQGRYGGASGGMIGYVLDRNVLAAMDAVEQSVQNHAPVLGVRAAPALQPSRCTTNGSVRETTHQIGGTTCVLQHLFLSWP